MKDTATSSNPQQQLQLKQAELNHKVDQDSSECTTTISNAGKNRQVSEGDILWSFP